jgi:spore coat protein U-like protein
MRAIGKIAFGVFAAAGLATAAQADTDTKQIIVSATVGTTCSFGTQALNFGGYTGTVDADASANITATCASGQAYSVVLNAGSTAGNTVTARKMVKAGDTTKTLNYALYTDSTRTTAWAGQSIAGTGNGTAQTITVYGRMPSGQTLNAGTYSDAVTATFTF